MARGGPPASGGLQPEPLNCSYHGLRASILDFKLMNRQVFVGLTAFWLLGQIRQGGVHALRLWVQALL